MNIWLDFGYSQNPYQTEELPGSADGLRLLVGRDKELGQLKASLTSTTLASTLEGDNGVGKTSLVAVAGYERAQSYRMKQTGQALLPLPRVFQVTPDDDPIVFSRAVMFSVAQQFLEQRDALREGGYDVPAASGLQEWLQEALVTGGGAGATALGFGGSANRSRSVNTSAGFLEAGLPSMLRDWLTKCFPTPSAGGFICCLDNLELLRTSREAREWLEALRDGILAWQGLRWVLIGSKGIIRTSVSSPRLEGRLLDPLLLGPMNPSDAERAIERRLSVFAVSRKSTPPVTPRQFLMLYYLVAGNMRNAMKLSVDFSLWLHANAPNAAGRSSTLASWVERQSRWHLEDTSLTPTAWRIFDRLIELGGSCSPSDWAEFGYEGPRPLTKYLRVLEGQNLVSASYDENDRRRKTIHVTPRGWFVEKARGGYGLQRRRLSGSAP